MGTEKDIIVALEFGTSAIRGIAGRKKADGTVQILGIEQEKAADSIQKGVIYNIDKTTQAICNIVDRLNEKLDTCVKKAYVGLSGQSLHTASNFISRNLEMKVKITPELVDNLMDNNRATEYTDSEILEVVPQEYNVGNHLVVDPVGIQSDQIEARFMNVVARTTLRENIERCMRNANLEIADIFLSPMALADALLSEGEKRSGCALVDFGAGTTTVSVYNGNLLRHLVVIPLGGNNITNDIANSKEMEFEEAELLKRKNGVAYVAVENDNPRQIPISNERSFDENVLLDIIGAREEEIIANVWYQIENMSDKLLSGIITTGGASQIKDMTEAIKHYAKFERVKAAKSLITLADVAADVISPQGIDTLIALLMHGESSCVTDQNAIVEIPVQDETDLKAKEEEEKKRAVEEEARKLAAEEEARKRAAEEERRRAEEEEAKRKEEEEKKKKENSFGSKLKKVGRWLNDLVDEKEE